MEQTECSETSAYKIQMPGNYPEEDIQHVISCLSRYDQPDLVSSHQVKSKSIYKCVDMATCLLTIRSVNIAKFTSLPPLSISLSSKQSFSNVSPNC